VLHGMPDIQNNSSMKKSLDKKEMLSLTDRTEWRAWLDENHEKAAGVWLVNYKKQTGQRVISWSEAVDEALCFGWIDSTARTLDNDRFIQFFTRRKPQSTWSKINKDKVKILIAQGLMAPAGLAAIKTAKKNGSWKVLDTVEALLLPPDLKRAFELAPDAGKFYHNLSRSGKKILLQWLVLAKTAPTRINRIEEIIRCGNENQLPKPFRRPVKS